MKTKNGILKIEEPCNQDWNKMKIEGSGRYCRQCTKVVTDFTNYTDEQIIEFLKKSKGEVCGRVMMRTEQMKVYQFAYKNSSGFSHSIFRYSIAGLLTFASLKGFSQKNIKNTEVISQIKDDSGRGHNNNLLSATSKKTVKISFRVTDKFTGKTLNSATIELTENGKSFKADENGLFTIEIPDSLKDKTLTFSIYDDNHYSQTRTLNPAKTGSQVINVSMTKESEVKMGKMVYIPDNDTTKKKCSK